jgi:hypothetical protein
MPARTLNDVFVGFFYDEIKVNLEVKMVITYKGQGNGGGKKSKLKAMRKRR